MKKLLPTSTSLSVNKDAKNIQGFTLIELLVVVTILAILGTIGITVFGGAQKTARDGKVKEEINQIGKSIETSRTTSDTGSVTYSYTNTNATTDFKTFPTGQTFAYCYKTGSSAVTGNPTVDTNWTVSQCEGGTPSWTVLDSSVNISAVKYWRICGRLESNNTPVCVSSSAP